MEDECLAATGRLWLWRRMPAEPLFGVPRCAHGVPFGCVCSVCQCVCLCLSVCVSVCMCVRALPAPLSSQFRHSQHGGPSSPQDRSSRCHTGDGSSLRADPAPPGSAVSDIAPHQWQAESRAGRPIDECRGRVRARGAPGLPSRAAVGPGRRERGVGGMARRLRAAMALLLLQALPEGLPVGAEPAQVGGAARGVWGRALLRRGAASLGKGAAVSAGSCAGPWRRGSGRECMRCQGEEALGGPPEVWGAP